MSIMAVCYQTFDSTKVGAPNRIGSETKAPSGRFSPALPFAVEQEEERTT
jgi:hypothetical protein